MNRVVTLVGTLAVVALAGCESLGTAAQSKTNQGAVLGGLLGAGTGAIVGNQMHHHAGAGTAIGAALGALGGGLVGHGLEEQSQATQRQQFPPATPVTSTAGANVKFCPVGGETYSQSVKYCPLHGVELKYKDQTPTAAAPATSSTTSSTPSSQAP